ncbi:primase C-terminal domain-containing protein [Pantoea vagans]|uniref:primase C-terminal domain-containing protein n=1 Tax=Pantoea vagans TaxID=470934 RepID=UPI003AACF297
MESCYERVSAYNLQFAALLNENEVRGIAKSIAKWTQVNFNCDSFNKFAFRTRIRYSEG